jgi:hypothetical protein
MKDSSATQPETQRANPAQSSHDKELGDWAQTFGTTPERLRRAVNAVGISPRKVRAHLRQMP